MKRILPSVIGLTLVAAATGQSSDAEMRVLRAAMEATAGELATDVLAQERTSVADLGLTVWALVGSSSLGVGPHQKELARLAEVMLARQWEDGSFYDAAAKGPRVRACEQAFATLGLVELAAVTKDEKIRDAAVRAVERTAAWVRQDGTCPRGYQEDDPADFDATAWTAFALAASRIAQVGDVDREQLLRLTAWLREHTDDRPVPSRYRWRPELDAPGRLALVRLTHRMAGMDPDAVGLGGVDLLVPRGSRT